MATVKLQRALTVCGVEGRRATLKRGLTEDPEEDTSLRLLKRSLTVDSYFRRHQKIQRPCTGVFAVVVITFRWRASV